jgi:hypothetical protein
MGGDGESRTPPGGKASASPGQSPKGRRPGLSSRESQRGVISCSSSSARAAGREPRRQLIARPIVDELIQLLLLSTPKAARPQIIQDQQPRQGCALVKRA